MAETQKAVKKKSSSTRLRFPVETDPLKDIQLQVVVKLHGGQLRLPFLFQNKRHVAKEDNAMHLIINNMNLSIDEVDNKVQEVLCNPDLVYPEIWEIDQDDINDETHFTLNEIGEVIDFFPKNYVPDGKRYRIVALYTKVLHLDQFKYFDMEDARRQRPENARRMLEFVEEMRRKIGRPVKCPVNEPLTDLIEAIDEVLTENVVKRRIDAIMRIRDFGTIVYNEDGTPDVFKMWRDGLLPQAMIPIPVYHTPLGKSWYKPFVQPVPPQWDSSQAWLVAEILRAIQNATITTSTTTNNQQVPQQVSQQVSQQVAQLARQQAMQARNQAQARRAQVPQVQARQAPPPPAQAAAQAPQRPRGRQQLPDAHPGINDFRSTDISLVLRDISSAPALFRSAHQKGCLREAILWKMYYAGDPKNRTILRAYRRERNMYVVHNERKLAIDKAAGVDQTIRHVAEVCRSPALRELLGITDDPLPEPQNDAERKAVIKRHTDFLENKGCFNINAWR